MYRAWQFRETKPHGISVLALAPATVRMAMSEFVTPRRQIAAGHVAREKLFEDELRQALKCSMPLWHTALHGDTIYQSTPQLWSR